MILKCKKENSHLHVHVCTVLDGLRKCKHQILLANSSFSFVNLNEQYNSTCLQTLHCTGTRLDTNGMLPTFKKKLTAILDSDSCNLEVI